MKFSVSVVLFWCLVGLALAGCGVIGPGIISQNQSEENSQETAETRVETWEQLNLKLADAKADITGFKYDQAIESCTEILNRRWPNTIQKDLVEHFKASAYLIRAQAFAGKGFPLIALDDLDDAVDYGDQDTKILALVERARVALALKRWTRAIGDCSSAIRLRPDFGQAYLVRSQALSAAGKPDMARKSLVEAERLGIRTTFKVPLKESAFDQATEQMKLGHPGVAIEILSQALLRGQSTWQIQGLMAQAQYEVTNYSEAIIASNRALRLDPKFVSGYKIRGLSHFQQHDYDAAIVDFQSAIDLDETAANELIPYVEQAIARGGMTPELRIRALSKIRAAVVESALTLPSANASEQWLLELNAMVSSTEQVNHLRELLNQQESFSPDDLKWLSDYLMLERQPESVKNLTSYLQRPLVDEKVLSESERYLRELTSASSRSVVEDVNLFPDPVSYAVHYEFNHLLQACIDEGRYRAKAEHVSQAFNKDNVTSLRILLPAAPLLNGQVKGLLRQAITEQKVNQARLLIDRYNDQLNAEISEFLGITP